MNLTVENITENMCEIKKDIDQYSPYPHRVKMVAVTKYVDSEAMEKVLAAGLNEFGENKVQLMKEKYDDFSQKGNSNINWHFIGNLQTNKVKYIVDFVSLIHSVNRLSLAVEIDRRAAQHNKVVDVLLEINISGEESKEGYNYEDLIRDIPKLMELKNINIKGLMTIAPYSSNELLVRNVFKRLREIKEDFNNRFFHGRLTELSMGMSNDYKIALEEGATIIRIGRKLYN